jgi:tetratricopeptide (TPR) repeat protein
MIERACRKPVLLLVALALVVAPSCKPKPPIPVVKDAGGKVIEPPPPPKAEDEAAANAIESDAERMLEQGDTGGAQAKRDLLIETYPGTAAGARELERRGIEAEEAGEVDAAISVYEKLLFYRPSHPGADGVRERYASLLLRVGRYEDAENMLRALFESIKSDTARERIGLPLAEAYSHTKRARDALEIYVALHALKSASEETKKTAGERAFDIVAAGLAFKDAEDLWGDVEGKPPWHFILPALGFKLAKIYYHTRDYDESEAMLRLVSDRFPATPYGSQARDFLARLRDRFRVEPSKIGVLLPLSGRYQQYGNRSLAAIKMAFGGSTHFDLVVKDTGGNPTAASKGVMDLVLEEHVIAIIGPLFSNEALAAALKAEELSVPLIALSHRDGLPQIGDWVFRTALTVEAQARALAKVAFEELGMSRFALLFPRSRYGKEFADAFWDAVDERRGEVRAVESYEPDQTSFQEPVRKLVGRYYLYSRRDYIDALRAIKARRLPSHIEKRKIRELEKMCNEYG